MFLCIDSSVLKTSPEVQRDVRLEEIMNNHTKYYNTEEEALKDNFVPLDFSVSIRSMYSNRVVEVDKGGQFRYYTNLTKVIPCVHSGYDLIMFLTSIGVMHNVDYALGFDDIMMNHSQFMPIGIYNPDPSVINPIIYCHVILSDEGAVKIEKFLKGDRRMINIEYINDRGNIKALLDTLIEVKEEIKDEPCDNN